MKGRTPTSEERKHMQAAAALGCIICLLHHDVQTPAMIHHMDGKTKPGAHFKTFGLCHPHHQGGNDCDKYTSRHPYKKRFEERYGTETELLEIVNNMIKG